MMSTGVPSWLAEVPLDGLLRIDLGLEGDWSATVTTVWRPDVGFLGAGGGSWCHRRHRPALELYFEDGWIGVRCDRRIGEEFELDEPRLRRIVRWVEVERGRPGDS